MKRVLFVDDEPQVLEGIRRIIKQRENQWEVAFAPGGDEALNLLGASPFDVIVSDLRMPGMDGQTLLKLVCEKYPAVVRIVLSGQAEMDDALRAVPVAHQFLVKPCDPDMLRIAIERATSLSSILSNKLLASMVGSVKDLPVLPRTYLALRGALANPNVSLRNIVGIIESDVGISAKILQLVNSAFFGLPREISTLQTAVSFLGTQIVQNLVLSAEVFHVFEKAAPIRGFSFEDLHMHSQLAAKIAGKIPASAHVHGVAIVAALLHDMGKLVLAVRSPKHFERAVQGSVDENLPLHQVEEQLIGVSHAEVGAYLLGIWGLPTPVVEAVAHHHQPDRIPHDTLDAVGIVHIANFLAHEHPVHPPIAGTPPHQPLDAAYLALVGLADAIDEWHEMAEASANEMRGAASVRT
jgi:putative nucleotidyltransferase with HDIG domain